MFEENTTPQNKPRLGILLVGMLVLCCGCGKNQGIQRAAICGDVTLDGVPIADGLITFFPCRGTKGPTAGAVIKNGKYSIATDRGPVVGDNRVEIHAEKKTGRKVQQPRTKPGTFMEEVVEIVPERYNADSQLTVAIKSGTNTFNFELASK